MFNLLRSGFFRYLHSTIFKVCSVLTLAIAVLFSYGIYRAAELNEIWFVFGTITLAILITFMIGTETSKCIRNKIPTGYTRTQIYFSELILANIFVVLFFIVFFVAAVCLNVRLLSHIPLKLAFQVVFGFLCMALLLANIVASLACVISAKTAASIVCLVMITVLFITSTIVVSMLDEPKFHRMGSNESGEWVWWEEKNTRYVDEPWRRVLTFYRDANPYGQRAEYDEILTPFLYSDEYWKKAMEATADTIGNDFLKREISENEQNYLNSIPFSILAPIPFFIFGGWLVFRKKSFQ